jgi:hypothetical protein
MTRKALAVAFGLVLTCGGQLSLPQNVAAAAKGRHPAASRLDLAAADSALRLALGQACSTETGSATTMSLNAGCASRCNRVFDNCIRYIQDEPQCSQEWTDCMIDCNTPGPPQCQSHCTLWDGVPYCAGPYCN